MKQNEEIVNKFKSEFFELDNEIRPYWKHHVTPDDFVKLLEKSLEEKDKHLHKIIEKLTKSKCCTMRQYNGNCKRLFLKIGYNNQPTD